MQACFARITEQGTFSEMIEKKGIAVQTNALVDNRAMGIIVDCPTQIHDIIDLQLVG